ncbi:MULTISPECIES: MarR family winged helix-turn-helix transcriptional regulator [Lactobacillaceae]|uniref:MarR family winged helix-turn-helix transcriptional regulator n=1 Tax=Lactobacillaceae TaxID=33958 RepID=UPI00145787D8|nr:MarR family transcriptional regulator [Lactobacillus sp. HBUAS51381]NLR10088.1 MarR family transcriptional regulator [Lactobacillus sp. HBUAS51381]
MTTDFFTNGLVQQLKMLNIAIEKEMNSDLKALGIALTGTQVAVLVKVYSNTGEALTQKQIETRLRLSHPTTRGIVKRLVATGLLQTTPGQADQRQVTLNLTSQGRTFMAEHFQQIQQPVAHMEQKLVRNLSATDQQALQRMVTTMLTTMKNA